MAGFTRELQLDGKISTGATDDLVQARETAKKPV
jgi:hypothetical protein